MQEDHAVPGARRPVSPVINAAEANASGVSWAAIFAGAAAAAALSLILVMLGFGLGLSAISPWSTSGAAATVGISAFIWLAVTQILASGMGGYLAGRLRVKWADLHGDEVYFRDTAHGMLSWAIATLVTAAFLGSTISGVIGGGAKMVGETAKAGVSTMAQSAAVAGASADESGGGADMTSYFVDRMFRSDQAPPSDDSAQVASEASRILLNSLRTGTLADDDKAYLARRVAERTNMSQAEAEKRVTDVYTEASESLENIKNQAKEAADAARKAAAASALWMFVALLIGAFFASLAAVWGGRRRDSAAIIYRTTA
ncbi:MAG TPA: hypothetical protein VNQ97_05170 [Burkholderiaceae bacterium]|nr:hypothetical protein [Burkholderiaceae bacterium]